MYKIYKIKNKKYSHEIYVGSTKKTLKERLAEHVYDKRSSVYQYIQRDGRENFEVIAIDYAENKKDAIEKEIFWTLFLKEQGYFMYNIQAGNTPSDETKRKMSKARKGRYTGKESSMYGKHHSEEAKRKMSEGHKGRYTGKDSYNARKVRCINDGKCFDCIKDAAEFYKIKGTNTHISDVCNGKRNHTHGLHFEYI